MQPFNFQRTSSTSSPKGRFLAGGTTLIDLMKLEVETPKVVVDINDFPWKDVEETDEGLSIGALLKNTALAHHPLIRKNYTVLSEALLAGASTQLRNKATTGGNLLQRTRCIYFRDPSMLCNKREPGSGCSAIEGHNRNLAILGTSDFCIASNPSDMNVALSALEAQIKLHKEGSEREVHIKNFHLLPGKTPHIETILEENELIKSVLLPSLPVNTKSLYLKLRDRASYEFALSSIAVVLTMKAGKIERIRLAMGGIGSVPWRVEAAEKILEGQAPSNERFLLAAETFLKGAKAYSENGFKIELAKRCFVNGLETAVARFK